MADNILFIGSHPDDIELGCAGTVSKHIALNDNVYVLVMTNGENGGHTPTMQECYNSLKSLGVKESNIILGNFRDGFLSDDCKTVSFIEGHIKRLSITKVYTHDPHDRHQDHRHCSMAVSAAARKVPSILLFQGPSTNVLFEPHYFVELEESHLSKKLECLGKYESQIKKGCFKLDWIQSLAGVNGQMCNARYAEAYAINHIFEGGNRV